MQAGDEQKERVAGGRAGSEIRAALANILQAQAVAVKQQAEMREQRRLEAEQTVNILREMSAALRANTEAVRNLTRAYGAVCLRLDLLLKAQREVGAALDQEAILAELDALAALPEITLDERHEPSLR
jgi:hypothetical protein